MKGYYIDHHIDGHPICKDGRILDKKQILELLKSSSLDIASQQMVGFVQGKSDGCIINLAEGMALTEKEWRLLKAGRVTVDHEDVCILDNHFKSKY